MVKSLHIVDDVLRIESLGDVLEEYRKRKIK